VDDYLKMLLQTFAAGHIPPATHLKGARQLERMGFLADVEIRQLQVEDQPPRGALCAKVTDKGMEWLEQKKDDA
jgi:hypothetical protein